jgi:hypothetical protein
MESVVISEYSEWSVLNSILEKYLLGPPLFLKVSLPYIKRKTHETETGNGTDKALSQKT